MTLGDMLKFSNPWLFRKLDRLITLLMGFRKSARYMMDTFFPSGVLLERTDSLLMSFSNIDLLVEYEISLLMMPTSFWLSLTVL